MYKHQYRLLLYTFCLSFILLFQACSLNNRMARRLDKTFKESAVVNQYAVGFALYDLEEGRMIYGKNESKYFTPASNTKLFTFYGGLKMLGDSVPALRYIETGDSLIFWGTGDPSFLQSKLKGTKGLEFLRNSGKKLFFAAGRYKGAIYGPGWSWDDYNDYYQAEINELPLMDNLVAIKQENGRMSVSPLHFRDCFVMDSLSRPDKFKVTRALDQNVFHYPNLPMAAQDVQLVPYKINTATTLNLLTDTLKREVNLIDMEMPATAKTIYNVERDSVLKEMMLPSDNFIAEQLLLVYANSVSPVLQGSEAIAHISATYLKDLPDKPIWVDGSGLSRLNLFTPRSVATLLGMIYREVGDQKKLFSMLPAGGYSGTLRNAYPKTNQPFVFGKTGSLSNIHNQSGYVVTKKGKIYIYAFLNNNFVLPTSDVRKEMERIVTMIHERF